MSELTKSSERFTDTGEAWEEKDIRAYHGEMLEGDYHILSKIEVNAQWARQSDNIENQDHKDFYDLLIEKKEDFLKLPPYLNQANQWESLYTYLCKLEQASFVETDIINEILKNIKGKIQIMQAREEYLKNTKSALEKQEKASVNGADWSDERIEEYRNSDSFKTDYNRIMGLHIKLKNTLEFNEIAEKSLNEAYELVASLYDSIVEMPIYALDDTFKWWVLGSDIHALGEHFEGKKKELLISLVEIIDMRDDC